MKLTSQRAGSYIYEAGPHRFEIFRTEATGPNGGNAVAWEIAYHEEATGFTTCSDEALRHGLSIDGEFRTLREAREGLKLELERAKKGGVTR